MPPRRARCSAPAAVVLALAAACGLAACGSSARMAAPDPTPASSGSDAPSHNAAEGPRGEARRGPQPTGSGDGGAPDGGVKRSQAGGGSSEGPSGPRFEVRDADSTCSEDEQCLLTRYPGCCCSTTDSAMPRPFAISKPDLEARRQWCDSHVERIDCELSRCPPPASEQPEPAPRTVACVDGHCVSRTAEP